MRDHLLLCVLEGQLYTNEYQAKTSKVKLRVAVWVTVWVTLLVAIQLTIEQMEGIF